MSTDCESELTYDTEASDCDVADADRVREYRAFKAAAYDLLKGDKEHSIWVQLLDLFWQDAAFRVFNEARRGASEVRPNAAVAPLLGSYLDGAYVLAEVTAISRLTDPPSSDPDRGLVSIPTVVKLIRDNRHLLIRELYVCHGGLPYDVEAARAREQRDYSTGVRWVARTPADDAEDLHEQFDRLSGVLPGKRTRSDRVKPGLLKWFGRHLELDEIRNIRRHRNKVIAHSADRTSRGAAEQRLGLSFAAVDRVHRALLEVAEVLSVVTQGQILIGGPIAIPQFDQFEGLDGPFVRTEALDGLSDLWDRLTREREGWSDGALGAALPLKTK